MYIYFRFDILVNGGGSVTLKFSRQPFLTRTVSVLVPWNQIITMETVVMALIKRDMLLPNPSLCGVSHDHYKLQPVVLSTWQHTQLGSCPEKSTIIPESQVKKNTCWNFEITQYYLVRLWYLFLYNLINLLT